MKDKLIILSIGSLMIGIFFTFIIFLFAPSSEKTNSIDFENARWDCIEWKNEIVSYIEIYDPTIEPKNPNKKWEVIEICTKKALVKDIYDQETVRKVIPDESVETDLNASHSTSAK